MNDIIVLNVVCYTLYTEISIWYELFYLIFTISLLLFPYIFNEDTRAQKSEGKTALQPACFWEERLVLQGGEIQNTRLFSKILKRFFPFIFITA